MRLTEVDYDVLQSEIAHPAAQASQIFGYDIFCDDAAAGADDRRQPYDVIAAAGANVCDGHPRFDADQTHKLAWFAGIVALIFVVPDWADNVRDRAIGFWKSRRRRAGPLLRRDRYRERGSKDDRYRCLHHVANWTSRGLPIRS